LLIPEKIKWVFLGRVVFGYTSVTGMFLSVFYLPFSLAIVLTFTQPVFAALIARIFHNERLNWFENFAIVFAMLGVIIMTYPALLFPSM